MQNNDFLKLEKNKEFQNEIFLNILSSYVCGKESVIDLASADWEYLSSLSMKQGLGCIFYKAIEKQASINEDVRNKLEYYYQKSIFMCAARNELLVKISSAFENNEIDFVILKGAVLQGYYPSPELRVMSDIDFFIPAKQRKKAKTVLESMGVKFKQANSYQDIYVDCNGVIAEIHHALWGYNLEHTELYSNIWNEENLLRGSKHTYLLSTENLYVFTISHMLKHFKDSGIGLRPIFDIWYILKKNISCMNFSYIKNELSKFNAVKFEKNIRELVNCVFLGKEKNHESIIILKYLFKCDTHGTDNVAAVNEEGEHGAFGKIINRAFPPYRFMKRRYKILNYLPFLLPFCWLIRIITLPFKKDRLDVNVKKLKKVDDTEKQFIAQVFSAAGVKKFNSNRIPYLLSLLILLFLVSIFCVIFFQNGSILTPENNQSKEDSSEEILSEDIPNQNGDVYGTISWKGGIYTGYLLNNIPHGTGEHVVENRIRYVGVFVNGAYEGIGKIEYSDGSYYEGMFSESQANGEGTLYCANGDIINGHFTNGQPGGFCNYEYSDGNLFVGTMVNGLKHGEGTFYWLNGDKYVGSFVDDKRDGYGILSYSNGDLYTGNWLQGFCSGYGVYVWKDGRKYEGLFENGIMNDSECKITYPDGSVYVGEISEGLQNGSGTLTYSNGDIAKGKFSFGYLSGEAEYYFSEKKVWTKVIYEKGVIVKYIID